MRSSKSRSRSKSNRPRTLGNIVNRVFDSSGPEGKVRGTPQQIIEKYLILARDAQLSNDRVAAENFLQHAEHYTRMLGEAQREMAAEQEQRRPQDNGHGGGQQPRRDDRDGRPEFRSDRGDYRPEYRRDQRDEPEGVTGSEVIDLAGDDEAGLVETPEAPRPPRVEGQPRRDQRPPRENREPRDHREPRENREPREPRENREPREPREHREPRAPRAAEPAPQPAQAPAAAEAPAAQPEGEPARGPRRPRGPRKPREPQAEGGGDGPREAAE